MKLLKKILGLTFIFLASFIYLSNYAYASDKLETMKPVHIYNFDNDSNSTVLDSVTDNPVNGTIVGASRITGYDGTGDAIHFNGNSYISFEKNIIPTGKKTISFKIRKEKATGINEYIFANIKTYHENSGICALITYDGRLRIENAQKGYAFYVGTSNSICDNNWHTVLYTWDGKVNENSAKLYIDDMTTPVTTVTAMFADVKGPSYNFLLGSLISNSKEHKFTGDIDDFIVYDTLYLNAPIGLVAIADQEERQINVIWNSVPGATSYNIYRAETSGEGYVKIGSSEDTSFLDADPTLTIGKTYYYVVTAVDSENESAYSNEALARLETQEGPSSLKVVLEVKEQLQLSVNDDLEENTQMIWTSSDTTVAIVDADGIVTALQPGNTVVTVISKDGTYTDKINILVVDDANEYRLAVDLKVGKSCRLTVDDLTNTVNVTWTSMDSTVATVASNGKVTAVSKGLALVTAVNDKGEYIGQIYIRVRE